ncbi:VPLPA-CTERM sorting domain-containing protein [uncultured Tateyamaria sp.]|uniref:VPLPA-CTERM sorting domain-containing protein n=1 Tax=uncultured Tateyamaria sp. TaxID=455651 RepID=UPI0026211235|nr:VPLPA-CTERM sorting domain-containing protein [uncultured Tateyamaria sp.]
MKYIAISALIAVLGASAATANTITVLESNAPGGNYANALGATGNNLGAAPSGTTASNVIGTLSCRAASFCVGGRADPIDAFYFEVSANQQITELSISGILTGTQALQFIINDVTTSTVSNLFTGTIAPSGALQILSTAGTPIGPGTYNVGLGFFGDLQTVNDFSYAYTISSTIVETSPVPLPAGLPLLLAGLGAFGLMRRKRA